MSVSIRLLVTNRKSHTGFRLVPTSVTLNPKLSAMLNLNSYSTYSQKDWVKDILLSEAKTITSAVIVRFLDTEDHHMTTLSNTTKILTSLIRYQEMTDRMQQTE